MDIINSFDIENETFYYHDISSVLNSSKKLKKLPIVLKILLEANLRKSKDLIEFNKIVDIFSNRMNSQINFHPSRIIMQNFKGITSLIDLASIRDKMKEKEDDISKINPQIMVDMVIDNSLRNSNESNLDINKEYEKNYEKYEFVKWAENAFSNFRVIPPGSGICHEVNLEYLSTILHVEKKEDRFFLYPETICITDSNNSMTNSLGVLGLGCDGMQLESTILGFPLSLDFPKVVGVNIHKELKSGITSSDLVLALIKLLKEYEVEGKFIEFYGEGLKHLTLEDRSIICNMASEYKALCSFFAIDDKTISYFNKTRGNEDYSKLIKTYLEKQSFFYSNEELDYDQVIDFDLSVLTPIIIGQKKSTNIIELDSLKELVILNRGKELKDTDIVLASINSCISTSNPYLLIHAALIAKKALEFGLTVNKNIKCTFSPDSIIVKEYLEKIGLLHYLEKIGFNIVSYGCGDSKGSEVIDINLESDIRSNNLNVCAISSIDKDYKYNNNPLIKSNYLMSPSLIVIYSLIGSMKFNLFEDIIGVIDDKDIKMKDLWPTGKEVGDYLEKLDNTLYKDIYKNIFKGNDFWQKLIVNNSDTYNWNSNSTFIQSVNFLEEIKLEKIEIKNAEILAIFGDFITTEHISPLGQISLHSPASKFLETKGLKSFEYDSFENRRGNAEVMVRGIFDNIKVQNQMISKEGGYTIDYESNEIISIYDKSQKFMQEDKIPIIFAGEGFGKGDSRDWAVKGIRLLGVRTIIAKSFSEIYRKSLISMGVLPLEFINDDIQSLKLKGNEKVSILSNEIKADSKISVIIHKIDFDIEIDLKCRLDNDAEVEYYKNGGILSYFFKNI
ncbi:aconitate hydratase AcnA [Arcobacter sp. LA11]|uniref:aconitate hydratase AcnA n=1 Tax=Arcobacter sp. LA11 TaxID=1898176 RepID=UPI000932F3A8|nr:aconitate hydratase AcnA [Arcobacter sp. LA11]